VYEPPYVPRARRIATAGEDCEKTLLVYFGKSGACVGQRRRTTMSATRATPARATPT
jgi:hypothetical protein